MVSIGVIGVDGVQRRGGYNVSLWKFIYLF